MLKRLQHLGDSIGAEFKATQSSYILVIRRADEFLFEIVVPNEVLEWYTEAKINGEVVWSDWADYYDESRASLRDDMCRDIECFARIVAMAPIMFHISVNKKLMSVKQVENKLLELYINNQWSDISIASLLETHGASKAN